MIAGRMPPRSAFADSAAAVLDHLNGRLGMDLWLVTRIVGDDHLVMAAAGPRSSGLAAARTVVEWPAAVRFQLAQRGGPVIAFDTIAPSWPVATAVHASAPVRAVIEVPLRNDAGELIGILAAFASTPRLAAPSDLPGLVHLLGQLLSAVLAGEHQAHSHWKAAAAANALAEQDRLTGLLNRRGWAAALTQESGRTELAAAPTSIIILDLDDLKSTNDTAGHLAGDGLLVKCAAVLTRNCRPGDSSARLGGDEFGVLAVNCDAEGVRAILGRTRVAMRAAGVVASAGAVTRRAGEDLADTWKRADEAMYQVKRRRERRRSVAVAASEAAARNLDDSTGRAPGMV